MRTTSLIFLLTSLTLSMSMYAQEIPLPEHPRPDFEREAWLNLNGSWEFKFDSENKGVEENWAGAAIAFEKEIQVPFPWGSALSGVEDEADVAWYRRSIQVDPSWKSKRVFLTIGASDWETEVWLGGAYLGVHRGGYVPFSFELTDHLTPGREQDLVIRVDDQRREFTLYGKQGYGNARGIWQTVYLEARGKDYLDALHFTPDIDQEKVEVTAWFPETLSVDVSLKLVIKTPGEPMIKEVLVPAGKEKFRFIVDLPYPRLWDLEDPYLYEVTASLGEDVVHTYFGMRKISVVDLPGTDYPYIALNNKPVYLQLALDQSYHPEGFYTFPSDAFLKEEILRSKSIGLNGIRTHIKVEVPRKLYWADKLGLLVMEDLPNSWGEPDRAMQKESEYTLREMIKRDYNHPSIFSWVIFNETWGLYTKVGENEEGQAERRYLPETQAWVASMYYLAKSLDMTRLVEDNSICCGRGHTETDINSWHAYLPGYEWDEHLTNITQNNFPGSQFHFEEGYLQGDQPNINSECGNVWGYKGSTGDVDWSWDYHRMMNSFRRFPEVAGWLYTEHHDVINEWNGYWRFDRSEKKTGFEEIHKGMTLNDMHSPIYLSTGNDICLSVEGGQQLEIPLFLSSMTGQDLGTELTVTAELELINRAGESSSAQLDPIQVAYSPWMQEELEPYAIQVPQDAGLACLKFTVHSAEQIVLHRNFVHLEIATANELAKYRILTAEPADFADAVWTQSHWSVREGRKMNGTGKGHFTYHIAVPPDLSLRRIRESYFLVELSAKELFVKDKLEYSADQDFMLGSRVYPSANPNSYPMTDETLFPSDITVLINGQEMEKITLPDDPADHRGVLSWHHQLENRELDEAGSYGYLLKVPLSVATLEAARQKGYLEVEIRTEGEGGIAIYGKEFGRYPFDPSLVIEYK